MTVDDCARASRAIEARLDAEDFGGKVRAGSLVAGFERPLRNATTGDGSSDERRRRHDAACRVTGGQVGQRRSGSRVSKETPGRKL